MNEKKFNVWVEEYPHDERKFCGISATNEVIASEYYEPGEVTQEELFKIIDQRDKLTFNGKKLSRLNLQVYKCTTMELWLHC